MTVVGLLSVKEKQRNVKEEQRSGVGWMKKKNRNELLVVGERKNSI